MESKDCSTCPVETGLKEYLSDHTLKGFFDETVSRYYRMCIGCKPEKAEEYRNTAKFLTYFKEKTYACGFEEAVSEVAELGDSHKNRVFIELLREAFG